LQRLYRKSRDAKTDEQVMICEEGRNKQYFPFSLLENGVLSHLSSTIRDRRMSTSRGHAVSTGFGCASGFYWLVGDPSRPRQTSGIREENSRCCESIVTKVGMWRLKDVGQNW